VGRAEIRDQSATLTADKRAEGGGQKAKERENRIEDRGQRTEVGGRKAESKGKGK